MKNFTKNQKCLNLELKMPYLDIFGLESYKTIVIFEINTFEFVKLQNFAKKQKHRNLEPKMPYLGIFGLDFQKTIAIFEISTF